MVLHGAHRVSAADLDAHAAVFRQRLASYPDWPELQEVGEYAACDVPASARPTTNEEV